MDASKIGNLIYELRVARNMTQKQLAERLFISDKTVSKWKRAAGFRILRCFLTSRRCWMFAWRICSGARSTPMTGQEAI